MIRNNIHVPRIPLYRGFTVYLFCINTLSRLERDKYYSHREKARWEPEKYITIILDGMDQSKTNLPYLSTISKSNQNLWRIRTHITDDIHVPQYKSTKLTSDGTCMGLL